MLSKTWEVEQIGCGGRISNTKGPTPTQLFEKQQKQHVLLSIEIMKLRNSTVLLARGVHINYHHDNTNTRRKEWPARALDNKYMAVENLQKELHNCYSHV